MFSRADLRPCQHCRKPVRWTTTEAGRPFAVNPDPDPAGNTGVYRDAPGTLRSRRVTTARPLLRHERLMMPHVATCAPPTPQPAPPVRTSPGAVQGRGATVYDLASYRRTR
ncbi:hypothetical protein [Streptosporangium sp. NPDC048865]|uniref:hypothetical protein n=1 Tax=Streptosporangium sp. NPDC048865 TaxID=3155766 RepID=UPI00342898DD